MFGRKIQHMLEIREMSQADLAKSTGLHRNTISDLINDKVTNTSTDTIFAISDALRISPSYFFENNAYTPLEALDLPDNIIEWVKKLSSMDYLVLGHALDEKGVDPRAVEKIMKTYEEVYHKNVGK